MSGGGAVIRKGGAPTQGPGEKRLRKTLCRVATIAAYITCLTRLLLEMSIRDNILVK